MLDAIDIGENDTLTTLGRMLRALGYQFVTTTPATHARVLARSGGEWAQDLRDVFGWSKPFASGVVPAPMMDAMAAAGSLVQTADGWRSLVRFSSLDGLLLAHSAFPTASTDAVFFGPDTYRFARAIERGLHRPVRRAVDIGCGSGAGAVLVARAHPAAEVFAVDINDAALRMTRSNAALAGVGVRAVNSDLLDGVSGQFDLIVANPPYLVDPAERAYRHGGGPLGAGLSLKILDAAMDRLAPGGSLVLYTGAAIVRGADPFLDAAGARLRGSRLEWRYEEVDPDVFGEELETGVYAIADRIAAVVLTVTRPMSEDKPNA
jgi:SAM-dependent methyltransferase